MTAGNIFHTIYYLHNSHKISKWLYICHSWNKQVSWVLADISLVASTLSHDRRASLWSDPSLASQCILSFIYDYDLDKYKPAEPFSETASAEHLALCLLRSKCPIKVDYYQQHYCSWSLGYTAQVYKCGTWLLLLVTQSVSGCSNLPFPCPMLASDGAEKPC